MSKVSIKDDPNGTKFEQLSEFITAIANDNGEDAAKHIQSYVNIKAKEIIQGIREDAKGKHYESETDDSTSKHDVPVRLKTRDVKKKPLKKMKKTDESLIVEEDESPIRLKNNDVFFEGKLVGTFKNDLNDDTAGITFESIEGKGGEFDNIKEFYAHLMKEYGKDTGLDK